MITIVKHLNWGKMSKNTKTLSGRKLKKHIQELYLRRLESDALFAEHKKTSGKIKITSRKQQSTSASSTFIIKSIVKSTSRFKIQARPRLAI